MCRLRLVIVVLAAVLLLLAALPASASASAGLAGFSYQREILVQENSDWTREFDAGSEAREGVWVAVPLIVNRESGRREEI